MAESLFLCGLPTLFSEGIRALLDEAIPSLDIRIVNGVPFAENALYVVGTECFLANLQKFMVRKDRVVVVSLTPCKNDTQEGITLIDSHIAKDRFLSIVREKQRFLRKNEATRQEELTARETEVLALLARGLTIKEIACELTISINTVLTHRKSISAKLGIRSVSGLSLYAMMNGVI